MIQGATEGNSSQQFMKQKETLSNQMKRDDTTTTCLEGSYDTISPCPRQQIAG